MLQRFLHDFRSVLSCSAYRSGLPRTATSQEEKGTKRKAELAADEPDAKKAARGI